jgi:PKD repeat protein
MDDRKAGYRYRNVWIPVLLVIILAGLFILPVSAADTATSLGVIPGKSDIASLAFANQPAGYYYFKFDQTNGGGLNALHIASSSSAVTNYGDVTTTTAQSGTFYITETGGRGYQDEAILLVAVKGEIPDNFAINIKSSGYSWTPTGEKDTPPSLSQVTYTSGAVDQTFTKSQFVYGSQTWKPAGNNAPSDYPLYYGQDTSDTTNTFKLMFVDLRAGPLGANGDIDTSTLTDMGAVKVDYTIENLDTVATFNTYAWNDKTTQGKGISWANRLVGTGSSGYTVLGSGYMDRASEFPTAEGSSPVYHAPETNFKADVTSGAAPLTVQFSDTTVQSVKTWTWDFGDNSTSTEKNPQHVYAKEGTYTVALTAANSQGLSATKTQTNMISVTTSSAGSSSAGSTGASYGENWTGGYTDTATGVTYQVNFTANATVGVVPLAVQFSDVSSIPDSTSWSWDFTGDGIAESSAKNPVFVFKKAGDYTVTLAVNTATGHMFNVTMPGYIHVLDMPALDSDVGWISSDPADAGRNSSGPGPQQAGTVTTGTFEFSGVRTGSAGTTQDILIDTSQATATTSGNVVSLTGDSSSWDHVEITFADTPVSKGAVLTGTVKSVQCEMSPVTVPAPALGNPGVTMTLDLARLPDTGASVTSTITSTPGTTEQSAFTAAAAGKGDQLTAIAYTVSFGKSGIANEEEGGIIRDATISMAVSPDWVTKNGGTGRIVILHRSDDGTTTILPTQFTGTDASGNDLFTAVSPTGLSTFALGAVAPAGSSTARSTGAGSPLGTKVAEVLFDSMVVVGVIGGGLLLWKRM